MTSSNGHIFRLTDHLCGEFTVHRWIPRTKASDAELWCFSWLAPEWRMSKQSWGWWFETPSRPLWRHSNDTYRIMYVLEWRTVCVLTRVLFWCLFPALRSNERNKHQNNTRESAQTVHHDSIYIILSLTIHSGPKHDDKKAIFIYRHRVSLALFAFG